MLNVIDANIVSPLLQTLREHQVNPFELKPIESYPNGMLDYTSDPPEVYNHAYGAKITFDLPRHGMWLDSYIKTTLTTDSDQSEKEENVGGRIFKMIQLRTKNRNDIIQTIIPEYTQFRVERLPQEYREAIGRLMDNDTVFDDNTLDFGTPLFLSCFDALDKVYPLHFVEDLQLVCWLNDDYGSMGFVDDVTIGAISLENTWYILETHEPVYLGKNYLSYDCFLEPVLDIIEGSTSTRARITCRDVIFNTGLVIKKPGTQELAQITDFSFEIPSQINIVRPVLKNILPWGWRDLNKNLIGISTFGTASVYISHSLSQNRDSQHGSINLADLPSIYLNVFYNEIDADYSLYILHEYWKIIRISPVTGVISIDTVSKTKKPPAHIKVTQQMFQKEAVENIEKSL